MKSIGDPDFVYRPWSKARRDRASAAAKKRLKPPKGMRRVYGQVVPEEIADKCQAAGDACAHFGRAHAKAAVLVIVALDACRRAGLKIKFGAED